MKPYLYILLLSIPFDAFAQLENTKWKTTIHAPDPRNVVFYFKTDTVTLYTVSDSAIIEVMTYSADNGSLIFTKISGQSDCNSGSAGKYGFTIKGDSLLLRLLKDDCDDRHTAFENTKWSAWKTYPSINVPEAVLKKYTGVYAYDEAHPIIISMEKGVLYAEGPNNNLPKSPFIPISTSTFFLRVAAVEIDFIRDSSGNVVKFISHDEKNKMSKEKRKKEFWVARSQWRKRENLLLYLKIFLPGNAKTG